MNILFLGGAKRVQMGQYFLRACRELGLADSRIYGYELEATVPLAVLGTIIIGKRWKDADILEHLHQVVREYAIDVIVPFVDGAVAVAADYASRYGDAFAPTGAAALCTTMFDKVAAAALFEQAGLSIPATVHATSSDYRQLPASVFPLIAKPRFGSASKGICVCDNADALAPLALDDYLLQEYIADRNEYTVDCYVATATGEPVYIVPRRRLEVEGGEVTRTCTVADPDLIESARQALCRLGLRGAVTVQLMRDRAHGRRTLLMEINPRLGGGATCAVAAGADLPRAIIQDALRQHIDARPWDANVEVARYRMDAIFRH